MFSTYCFPLQQELREHPSILRYTYIVFLAYSRIHFSICSFLRSSTIYFQYPPCLNETVTSPDSSQLPVHTNRYICVGDLIKLLIPLAYIMKKYILLTSKYMLKFIYFRCTVNYTLQKLEKILPYVCLIMSD